MPTLVATLLLVTIVGCVGSARTFSVYESKSADTAKEAVSVVETARLAAQAAADDKAFDPYLSVLLGDAEEQIAAVQGTFESIQPPDDRSDDLHQALDDLLTETSSTMSDLRIAARRGEPTELVDIAAPLEDLSSRLSGFEQDHEAG